MGRWGSIIESALLVRSLWTIQSGINDMPLSSEQDQENIGCTGLSGILRIGVISLTKLEVPWAHSGQLALSHRFPCDKWLPRVPIVDRL